MRSLNENIAPLEGDGEMEYRLGLEYCLQNDGAMAMYWLKRAASKKHVKSIEAIDELGLKYISFFLTNLTAAVSKLGIKNYPL